MKNYVYIYYNNGIREGVSPEDFKAEWGAWFGGLGDKLVDADITGKSISIRPEVDGSKPLGISSWATTAALRNLKLRKL